MLLSDSEDDMQRDDKGLQLNADIGRPIAGKEVQTAAIRPSVSQ